LLITPRADALRREVDRATAAEYEALRRSLSDAVTKPSAGFVKMAAALEAAQHEAMAQAQAAAAAVQESVGAAHRGAAAAIVALTERRTKAMEAIEKLLTQATSDGTLAAAARLVEVAEEAQRSVKALVSARHWAAPREGPLPRLPEPRSAVLEEVRQLRREIAALREEVAHLRGKSDDTDPGRRVDSGAPYSTSR
jgi:hypothetical protein